MQQKPYVRSYLMYLSLALLFSFLSWWIFGVYEDRKADFKRQIDLSLSDAIRNIQDSMVHSLLRDQVGIEPNEGSEISIQYIENSLEDGSIDNESGLKDVLFMKSDFFGLEPIQFNIEDSLKDRMDIIVKLLNLDLDDQVTANPTIESYVDQVKSSFDVLASKRNIPEPYRLIESKIEPANTDMRTSVFTDMGANKSYYIKVGNYTSHLIKKIFPYILFAILLFSSVTASFLYLNYVIKLSQHTVQLKNKFISNITHELKTPISTVKVALEAIQDFNIKDDSIKTTEYLDISTKELNRLSLLIDNVIKMSMSDHGWEGLNLHPLDLNNLVDEIVDSLSVQVSQLKCKMYYKSPTNPSIIDGDRFLLSHAISNVLDNALKYSGTSPEINIFIKDIDNYFQLIIIDNGPGIENVEKNRIFDRFYRISKGDLHNVKGHGIGLSHAYDVMQKHGGKILVEDNPTGGSIFILQFKKK